MLIFMENVISCVMVQAPEGEDLNSLQPKDLIMIEEALDNGLTNLNEKLVTLLNQSISMWLMLQVLSSV